jgi:hypothetical protein
LTKVSLGVNLSNEEIVMAKPLPKALQQQIAQSQLGSGPSLVPQAPPPKEKEVVPKLAELIAEGDDLETLCKLLEAVIIPQREIKRLEKVVEPMKDRIKALVGQYGIDKATYGEITLSYYPTSRTTINATKLLAAGVDQDVITFCTDTTHSYALKVI